MVYPYKGILFTHKKEQSTNKYMNPENIMLSERSQREGPYIISLNLYDMPRIGKSVESDEWFPGALRRGNGW